MPIPPSLLQRPGALLVIAARTGQEHASSRLAPLGLTVRTCGVLNLLADQRPLSQQAIGEMLGIDRTTMVEIVDELERAGIARRVRNPSDRRSYLVTLTPGGRTKQRRAAKAFDDAVDEFLSPLEPAERLQLTDMLRRLVDDPASPSRTIRSGNRQPDGTTGDDPGQLRGGGC
jgi:DNA-binding MarR family transcriptional regulator